MPVQKILTHPDEHLRRVSEAITCFDPNLVKQFEELEQIMRSGIGGVGIAAPQIGDNRRFIIVDCSTSLRPCKHHGLLYMTNPTIESRHGETLGREGCLSVPDWVGMVPRAAEITVSFDNLRGMRQTITATGFEARVIQHEIDHLDG
ncbi:MAG: peptide deformylase, partial [Mariprofundus sp.]|nr:peptide deformylase [Mariprofundus sp.]